MSLGEKEEYRVNIRGHSEPNVKVKMSSSEVHHSNWLLSFRLTLSNQHCMYAFVSGLDSFPLQTLHHKIEGVATRWLNKHIDQLPITQIHLAPSCQHVSHLLISSPIFGGCRLKEIWRMGRRRMNKNVPWWESPRGVLNFNHQDYPSSVALISPSRLPRTLPQVHWHPGEDLEWQHMSRSYRRSPNVMFGPEFLRALREAPRTQARG